MQIHTHTHTHTHTHSTKLAKAEAEQRDELDSHELDDMWLGLRGGDAIRKEEQGFLRAFSYVEVDPHAEL